MESMRARRHWGPACAAATLLAIAVTTPVAQAAVVNQRPVNQLVTDGTVDNVLPIGDRLFLAGTFDHIAPRTGPAVSLSASDGTPAGTQAEVSGGKGLVDDMVPDGSGGWYVGGDFDRVNDQYRPNLAHVLGDGTVDPDFPTTNGRVFAMEKAPGANVLYIAGKLNSVWTLTGGVARRGVAAIDLTSDEVTGFDAAAFEGDFPGLVRVLELRGDTLWMAGDFNKVGGNSGAPRDGIAAVDATTGVVRDGFAPTLNINGRIDAMTATDTALYVGGYFQSLSGTARDSLAVLDPVTGAVGSLSHAFLGGEAGVDVESLALSAGTLYVGGSFDSVDANPRRNLAAFDTATGALTAFAPAVGSADDKFVGPTTMTIDNGKLYLGGGFDSVAGTPRENAAILDLSSGDLVDWAPGVHGLVGTLQPDGDRVLVGGSFAGIGGTARKNLAAVSLDGSTLDPWTPPALAGGGDAAIHDVKYADGLIYMSGFFTSVGGQPRDGLAAIRVSDGGVEPWAPTVPGAGLSNLAIDGDYVYVGGPEIAKVGRAGTGAVVANWPAVQPDKTVEALAISGGRLYVGGTFDLLGATSRTHFGAFELADGSLTSFDPQPNFPVHYLGVDDSSHLLVGGGFTAIAGISPLNKLARLDTQTETVDPPNWTAALSDLPDGPFAGVFSTAMSGDLLYLAGAFQGAGSGGGLNLAVADSATGAAHRWAPAPDRFGSLTGGATAEDLAVLPDGSLVAAGDFTTTEYAAAQSFAVFPTGGAPTAWRPIETKYIINPQPAIRLDLKCDDHDTWFGATPITVTYEWLRDGHPTGATGQLRTTDGADVGHRVSCRATAANSAGSTTENEADGQGVKPGDGLAVIKHPTITGTLKVGKTLTCDPGTWIYGSDPTYTYSWFTDHEIAQGQTFVAGPELLGQLLECRVTATNAFGSQHAASDQTYLGTNSAPTGSFKIVNAGGLLFCQMTNPVPATLTVTWYRDGVAIPGVTAPQLTTTGADVGHEFVCEATATNEDGTLTTRSAPLVLTATTTSQGSTTFVPSFPSGLPTGFPSGSSGGSSTEVLTIRVAAIRVKRTALKRGLPLMVTANKEGRVQFTLRIDARTAKRLGLRTIVARRTLTVQAGTHRVVVPIPKTAANRLSRGPRFTLTIETQPTSSKTRVLIR
jgi:Domain of unknown function (DUF5122) beta-propeller